jgi:hypothetical protein
LPLGQANDLSVSPEHQSSQQKIQQQQEQRRLNAPERTWRQLGHMCVDGVSQLLVIFTHWWKNNLHLSQGTRLVVIDDFGHLMRSVPVRMAVRVLVEMKRAAQEYGFAIVVMSRLLAQWSVTGRRMMMVPGLPALNGVLDGRIVLCHDGGGRGGSSRVAARVQTGSGPDQAVLEVMRRVQFEVLADRVVDAMEKRDNDSDDDLLDAYPSKRLRIANHLNNNNTKNKAGNTKDSDEDGFSDIDFDDLVEAEKKDEIKKKSLLRIGVKPDNSNSSDTDAKLKLPLQGFMTSGELMQSMVEQDDLNSRYEDKPNVPISGELENGSTSPIRQEEATSQEAQIYSANPIDVVSYPANHAGATTTAGSKECASASGDKVLADSAESTARQETGAMESTTISASNVVAIGSSPLSGNMGNDPITPIVEVSSPEPNATDNALNKIYSPVPLNDGSKMPLLSSSISGNNGVNSPPLPSTTIVEVSSQETGATDDNNNIGTSLPPPQPFSAVDISSPESATSMGSSPTKPLAEVADSQDFGSDEIKLPYEFVLPESNTNVSP